MKTLCPICQENDMIQKVTSIVSSGKSSGIFSGSSFGSVNVQGNRGSTSSFTSLSGTSTTELASKLSKIPKKPSNRAAFRTGQIWFIRLYCFPYGGFLIIGGLVNISDWRGLLMFLGGMIWVILLIYWNKKLIEKRVKLKIKYKEEMEKWERAKKKHGRLRLYYCYRDDIVFDPENGEHFPPDDLMEYFYS